MTNRCGAEALYGPACLPIACAFKRGHAGPHAWEAIPGIQPMCRNTLMLGSYMEEGKVDVVGAMCSLPAGHTGDHECLDETALGATPVTVKWVHER